MFRLIIMTSIHKIFIVHTMHQHAKWSFTRQMMTRSYICITQSSAPIIINTMSCISASSALTEYMLQYSVNIIITHQYTTNQVIHSYKHTHTHTITSYIITNYILTNINILHSNIVNKLHDYKHTCFVIISHTVLLVMAFGYSCWWYVV